MSNYPPPPPNQGPPQGPGGPPQYGGPPQGPGGPGGPQYPGGPPQGPGGPQYPGGPPPYPGGPPPGGGGGISGKVIALIVVAVLVLAGGAVAAIVLLTGDDDGGGDADDAPKSASVEEFCDGLNEFDEVDDDASPEEQVEQAHEVADRLSEIGTPEDIPDDAREGFEIYLEAISEVDADDVEALDDVESEEELADALGISSEDQDKIGAFFEYTFTACSELSTPDIPSDVPTDELPTDIPTDIPTDELPTDFSLPTE